MPTSLTENARFYLNLEKARERVRKKNGYDSAATRREMTELFELCCPGKTPYPWQLDVAEALYLGLDCTVIAGTGSGKTMPFVMPGLLTNKTTLIISPLNALEYDQVRTAHSDTCDVKHSDINQLIGLPLS